VKLSTTQFLQADIAVAEDLPCPSIHRERMALAGVLPAFAPSKRVLRGLDPSGSPQLECNLGKLYPRGAPYRQDAKTVGGAK